MRVTRAIEAPLEFIGWHVPLDDAFQKKAPILNPDESNEQDARQYHVLRTHEWLPSPCGRSPTSSQRLSGMLLR
jgi:hypothetical protein